MSILLLALLGVCLLQSTVAHRLAIGGVQPDLFLVLVFGLSLSTRPELATIQSSRFIICLLVFSVWWPRQTLASECGAGLHPRSGKLTSDDSPRVQIKVAHPLAKGIHIDIPRGIAWKGAGAFRVEKRLEAQLEIASLATISGGRRHG